MKYLFTILILLTTVLLNGQMDSLVWENIDRTYLLHLPENYNETEEFPLVIAMHGGFGNAANIQNQSQLSITADQENFIVVYPEGVQGGVFNIRTWNAGWCCGHASSNDVDDVGFINNLIDTLINRHSIDTNRIYATGMSNGGFMSYRLACELSERIAAIAPVAASMSMIECKPNRPVPIMDFHSYLDTNVPYQGGIGSGVSTQYSPPLDSVLNVWSLINSCSISIDTIVDDSQFTHIKYINCECGSDIQQYITRDGGHSWPGGEATPVGDPVSNYINANELMWSFFEEHTLDCRSVSTQNIIEKTNPIFYPNPSNQLLSVTIPQNEKVISFSLMTIDGKLIRSSKTNVLNTSGLHLGCYLASLKTSKGSYQQKIIVN